MTISVYHLLSVMMDMCDVQLTIDGETYPAFFKESDAEACAMLLREESGLRFYIYLDDSDPNDNKPALWYVD